jgi:hypothetical protein
VRVIDEEGQPVGIIGVREALDMAKEKGLDLIEVAPNAQPPVCRIMDYGKYKYEQGKKEREQHRKSKPPNTISKYVSDKPSTFWKTAIKCASPFSSKHAKSPTLKSHVGSWNAWLKPLGSMESSKSLPR